jgi:hypothetical protein
MTGVDSRQAHLPGAVPARHQLAAVIWNQPALRKPSAKRKTDLTLAVSRLTRVGASLVSRHQIEMLSNRGTTLSS